VENMAACLTEAGIPAVSRLRSDGLSQLELETAESYWACLEGWCWMGGSTTDGAESVQDLKGARQEPPADGSDFLLVGQVDQTEAFTTCVAQTGYSHPGPEVDPAEAASELEAKRALVEVTLKWAACARGEGLTVKDPTPPVADAWTTRPAALVDPTISTERLRAVLEVCPSFDAAAAAEDLAAQQESDYAPSQAAVQPEIRLDAPGWRDELVPQEGTEQWTPQLQALWDLLSAANREFWDQQGGVG
jgi:hypothetical protein